MRLGLRMLIIKKPIGAQSSGTAVCRSLLPILLLALAFLACAYSLTQPPHRTLYTIKR